MHRILLIDDYEHLAAPLATYFARFDLTLDSAAHPAEGLAKLQATAYDAAILDVMLPGMTWRSASTPWRMTSKAC